MLDEPRLRPPRRTPRIGGNLHRSGRTEIHPTSNLEAPGAVARCPPPQYGRNRPAPPVTNLMQVPPAPAPKSSSEPPSPRAEAMARHGTQDRRRRRPERRLGRQLPALQQGCRLRHTTFRCIPVTTRGHATRQLASAAKARRGPTARASCMRRCREACEYAHAVSISVAAYCEQSRKR